MKRLTAIDTARGLAVLMMFINHATWRIPDLGFSANYGWNIPLPNAPHSIEGWINLFQGTPIFFVLTGISVALFEAGRRKAGWSEYRITRYFLQRGALIIAIDLLIIPWVITPEYIIYESKFAVLTCIGVCLWLLMILRRLSTSGLMVFATVLTLTCQIVYHLSGPTPDSNLLRSLLLYPSPADALAIGFPVLAWLPVICAGYISGRYAVQRPEQFRQHCLSLGSAGLLLWAAVTVGDIRLYHGHPFIMAKHPPDLAYLGFNIGAAYLIIAGLQAVQPPRFLSVLGRNALFFYSAHWYVLMVAAALLSPFLTGWGLYFGAGVPALLMMYLLCQQRMTAKFLHPQKQG